MSLTRASAAVIKVEEIVNNRNRIINGDMRIDQRNAGAVINTDNAVIFTVDRFFFLEDAGTTATTQQVSDAPEGFSNSFRFTNSASTATPTYAQLVQRIEGYNVADLSFGTAAAKTVTLSFWVKSSLTGQFSVSLRNSAANRSNVSTYTINSANTWEYKTITFVGDTSGTWLITNGNGLELIYRIAGSGGTSTLNQWIATGDAFASGSVNTMGTANATWQITGVQLEVGSVDTPFERRPFGTELMLCQRYFSKLNNDGSGGSVPVASGIQASTTTAAVTVTFPVTMRAEPTAIISNIEATDFVTWVETATQTSFNAGFNTAQIQVSHGAQGAQYRPVFLRIATDTSGQITFSAEL